MRMSEHQDENPAKGVGLMERVCADVLAVASHSNAIASIKPTILKEAVCFLLVTGIEDFIRAASGDFLHRGTHCGS